MHLQKLDLNDDQFRDYGNNQLKLVGKLQSNGWTTQVAINVIGGCRPSIIGRDLMPELGLMLIQAPAEQGVQKIQKPVDAAALGEDLDDWQKHFSKQFYNLFHRCIRNYKVRAEFFENLMPIQQKGSRLPITLHEKVDKEIDKLLAHWHIQKLEECSDK